MKRQGLAILAVVLTALSGGAGEAHDDLGLREFLFNEGFSVYALTNEICYLSFGSKAGTQPQDNVMVDPPDEFLKRFSSRPFTVRKASEYPKGRGPHDAAAKNPKTNVPDGLYTAEIVEWLDDTTARVRYRMFRASLWAAGYEAVAEKKEGRWRIKKRGAKWVS